MADNTNMHLSSNDIKKFDKTIKEFNISLSRQEEIAKRIFAIEEDIVNLRLGALTPYLDAYSKGLDDIIARKTSQLDDAFLILENKASETLKQTAYKATKDSGKKTTKAALAQAAATEEDKKNTKNNNTKENDSGKRLPSFKANTNSVSDEKRAKMKDADSVAAGDIIRAVEVLNQKYKTIQEQAQAIEENKDSDVKALIGRINDYRKAKQKEADEEHNKSVIETEKNLVALMSARYQTEKEHENTMRALKDQQNEEYSKKALDTQNLINEANAKWDLESSDLDFVRKKEEIKLRSAEETQKSIQEIELLRAQYVAEQELKFKKNNTREIGEEERANWKKDAADKFKLDQENIDKLTKIRQEKEKAAEDAEKTKKGQQAIDSVFSLNKDKSLSDRINDFKELKEFTKNSDGTTNTNKALLVAVKAISSIAKQLETTIDEIASYKGAIDTRLQGSSNKRWAGSYWDQLVHDMTRVGAINPYFKQSDFAKNIANLVDKGIAFNLEQRAFLETIHGKIATTFEVADGTLLKLIRIQQQDTTAGRLGMEASLNAFLNNMYETTEYLESIASNVRADLYEMEALMSGTEATEVEYQVQKWLGSLFSVGMSDSAVGAISKAFGQIAAGQIEGLTGGGAGNLLIMAANDAGVPITNILTEGISAENTNKLLQAAVNYLAELADSAKDNQVVQQQLAGVFGVSASDLKAATSLVKSSDDVFGSTLTYDSMIRKLEQLAGSMWQRTSIAEMMTNIWDNGQYTIAGSMASNPISYLIYKVASLVGDTAGGIPIPDISVVGNMVGLNTTVSDFMRVAAVGTGILGSIGALTQGLSNSFSGRAMLNQLGIKSGTKLAITPRGDGTILKELSGGGDSSLSESGYVGNSNSSDVLDSTMQEAEKSKKQLMVEAQEEEATNQVSMINSNVIKIYELLDDVVHGKSSLSVKVEGYGLTKAGSSSTLGGVTALGSSSSISANTSLNSATSSSTSGTTSLGGWTTKL